MKKIRVLVAFAMCLLLSLPAMAQFSQYKSYNGKYEKKVNGCTIEAKIDFNGIPHEGYYIGDDDSTVDYTKYYGYIKLICNGQEEGYDIVDVIPAGDGPILMLAGWQFPRTITLYPNFDAGTLQMHTGLADEYDAYLSETLKKVQTPSTAKTGKRPASKAGSGAHRKR
ncbi:MAG: hypothetical protein HDS53_03310 [Barnesiella sp.]|nr:hypothetical protein [Barnesiella sp.]